MSQGIGREDLKDNAVNYEKASAGQRLVPFGLTKTGPASSQTELSLICVASQDFQIGKAVCQLDHDGTGSLNEVSIDILDDGTSILTATSDLIIGTDAAGDAPEAMALDTTEGADLTLIAKGSVLQAEFTGAGTVTTPSIVGVYIEGHFVD